MDNSFKITNEESHDVFTPIWGPCLIRFFSLFVFFCVFFFFFWGGEGGWGVGGTIKHEVKLRILPKMITFGHQL